MTDDASPGNLRKFLESDDPAMVRMGISLAKGTGVEVTIKDLGRFLKSEDVETIKTGVMLANEADVGDEAMEMLCKPLGDEDEDVRRNAAYALGEIGDARAVEPLSKTLGDDDGGVRQVAMEALGEIGGDEAIKVLCSECRRRLLDSGEYYEDDLLVKIYPYDYDERMRIVEALGETGDARAIEPLIEALGDENDDVRGTAIQALDELEWKPDTDELCGVYLVAKEDWNGCVKLGGSAVGALIDELSRSGSWGGSVLVSPLVKIGEPAVLPLIGVLFSENWHVSEAAAKALGEIGDARAVEPLIRALGRYSMPKWLPPPPDFVDAVVSALVKIGKPAVEPLIKALEEDGNPAVRYYAAAKALVKIGKPAVEPLIKALNYDGYCIEGFSAEASAKVLDALKWKPDTDELRVAYLLAKGDTEAFVKWGEPAVDPLIAALGKGSSTAAVALGKIGDVRAVDPLIEALGDENEYVRSIAANALGVIGDARAVEPLIKALGDVGPHVRESATKALVKITEANIKGKEKENILRFLVSKDPAMVLMGASLLKGILEK